MSKKITSLTKEQWDSIPEYIKSSVDECSQDSNKELAEESIIGIYEDNGFDRPIIIWGRSPMECVFMNIILNNIKDFDSQLGSQLGDQLRSQLGSQLGDQLRSQLWSQLGSQLDSQLWSQLGDQLDYQLRSQLRSQLDSQLRSQLGAQLRSQLGAQLIDQLDYQLDPQLRSQLGDQLWSQLDSQLGDQLGAQLGSQLDSQLGDQLRGIYGNMIIMHWRRLWSKYYKFCQDIGVSFDIEKFKKLSDLSDNVDTILPYKGIVFMSEKPNKINWQDGILHSTDEAAIVYKDGYKLYSLEGVRVDEQIVMQPESITVEQIKGESNQERRRIMIQQLGVDKYLQDINAEIVDVDMRGVVGAGARALMKEDTGDCWLVGTDGSTDRVYHMYIGKNYTSCRSAHEALCGFSEELIKAEG